MDVKVEEHQIKEEINMNFVLGKSSNANMGSAQIVNQESNPAHNNNVNKENNIVENQRTHSLDKPYQCSQCVNSVAKRYTLVGHQKIHTGRNHINAVSVISVLYRKYI